MKKQWAFSTYLYSLCIMLFSVLLIVGAFSHVNIEKLAKLTSQITNNELPAVREMTLIDMFHDGLRAVTFRSLLTLETKDAEERQATKTEFKEFSDEIKSHISNLKKLPDLNPDTKAAIDAALPEVESYVLAVEKVVVAGTEGKRAEAYALMPDFFKRFEALESQLEILGEKIETNSKNSSLAATNAAEFAKKANFGMIIFFSVLGFAYAITLIRKLKNSIVDATTKLSAETVHVTSTSAEINSAAMNLSDSTSNQAAAIQQAVAALDEITAMVKKTSDNSDSLANSAETSNKSANEGQQAISEMLNAMEVISDSQSRIVRQVEDGNQKINEIVKVIGEIGDKTKVINDIVFQTKLLSFNASVEAARAGEHGKGFAVVAEEVGNLAQMSGNAAKEISDMLSGSMEHVRQIVSENKQRVESLIVEGKSKLENGTEVAKRCGTALNEIVHQSQAVGQMIEQITTAIHEQNIGLQEVSKSVQSLDQSTHENAAMSRQTTATSETMNQQAGQLLSIVQQLETIVHGHALTRKQNLVMNKKPKSDEHTSSAIVSISALKAAKREQPKPATHDKKPEATTPAPVTRIAVGSSVVPSHDDPRFEDI